MADGGAASGPASTVAEIQAGWCIASCMYIAVYIFPLLRLCDMQVPSLQAQSDGLQGDMDVDSEVEHAVETEEERAEEDAVEAQTDHGASGAAAPPEASARRAQ